MAPLEELDFPAVVVTSALLGLQGMAQVAPLVTKDKQAFQETLDPQASQVRPEDLRCSSKMHKVLGSVMWVHGFGFSSFRGDLGKFFFGLYVPLFVYI